MTPASWLLAAVALALIGVLTYYLTLTTRPEISELSPAPNSSSIPGLVDLGASVNSPRSIEHAMFLIDDEEISPTLQQEDDSRWRVHHQQVFERGERNVLLRITDSSGRTAEHSWTFQSGGDLIEPRMVLLSPPPRVELAPGRNGVTIQATTFADIQEAEVTFDGESVETDIEPIEGDSEYTNQDDRPIFDWHIRAAARLHPGLTRVEATVTDEHDASETAVWAIIIATDDDSATARFFEQTGEYIMEPFLSHWDDNDGATTIGPPVGPAFTDEDGQQRQYFRHARLELDEEGIVHRGLIGREMFGSPENPPERAPGRDARQFDSTGHYIMGTIREFWEDNGELETFGYPVSQEFETDTGYAQYFERALIEVTTLGGSFEYVELAPLGERLYDEHLFESPAMDDEHDDAP